MIHYPISTLMNAGLREILIITTPRTSPPSPACSATAATSACVLTMSSSPGPKAWPKRFLLGENFLDGDSAALVLGTNIFHGPGLGSRLRDLTEVDGGHLRLPGEQPERVQVVEFDADGLAISLEDSPPNRSRTTRSRVVLLRPRHRRIRQDDPPVRARGTGDHRDQRALPARAG